MKRSIKIIKRKKDEDSNGLKISPEAEKSVEPSTREMAKTVRVRSEESR